MQTPRIPVLFAFLVGVLSGPLGGGARGSERGPGEGVDFKWFPGAARAVSHSLSASQDTAVLGYAITPFVKMSGGGDFAFFKACRGDYCVRPGMFGMATLEGWEPYSLSDGIGALIIPEMGKSHYRGLLGGSVSVEFARLSEKLFGGGAVFETVVSLRHESESYTTERWGTDPQFVTVPNIGQFVMHEAAVRIPVRQVDLEFRIQNKFFIGFGRRPAYTFGPGADLIARWRITARFHPFTSTFFEYLFGNERKFQEVMVRIPDNYYVRNLTGLIFHSESADVMVFLSFRVGHGKGLLAFREEFICGSGVRLVMF